MSLVLPLPLDLRLLLRVRSGSHAYGLALPSSDIDERGVFFRSDADYAELTAPVEQFSDVKNDHVFVSLRKTFELLLASNPGMLEILFSPEDCVLDQHPAWQILLRQRNQLISKAAVSANLNYGIQQIQKARGHNKWINHPQPEKPPTPTQFCHWIPAESLLPADAKPARPRSIEQLPFPLPHCHVARVEHASHCYRLYGIGASGRGVFRAGDQDQGLPVCESITEQQERESYLGLLWFNQQGFQKAQADHQHYWQWRRNRSESRWQAQERGELDYDAKNMMHCLRLLHSAQHMLREGEPLVRVDAALREQLLAVRAGQFSYEELLARAEQLQSVCTQELSVSGLPLEPQRTLLESTYQSMRSSLQ